jgi:hypothetical protein
LGLRCAVALFVSSAGLEGALVADFLGRGKCDFQGYFGKRGV